MSEKIIRREQPGPSRLGRFLGAVSVVSMARGYRLHAGSLDDTPTLSGIPMETIGDALLEDLDRAAAEHDEPRIYLDRG